MQITTTPTFAEHLERRGLGARTVDAYVRDVEQFQSWIDHRGRTGDLATDVIDWANALRGDVGAATLRRYLVSAKAYLRFLGVDASQLDGYKAPPLPDANPTPLTGGVPAGRMLMQHATSEHVRVVAGLQLLAGLRVSEAIAVTLADVDFGRRRLTVKGKGEKVRYLPISDELEAIIVGALVDSDPARRLAPITNAAARFGLVRAGRRAGLGQVSSHDLRATFATAVFAATKDILMVSRLLGHASVETTQRYLGFDNAAAEAAVNFA